MTSAHADRHLPHAVHGDSAPTAHHEIPYVVIFFALVGLTIITVAVALHRFEVELINVLLALAVASIKGSLVALFFMHLKFEGKLICTIFIVPLCLCVLLVTALIPDIVMTGADSSSASQHLFNKVTTDWSGKEPNPAGGLSVGSAAEHAKPN